MAPTPTALRLLRGNPGHQKIRPEPMPRMSDSVPEPPDFLPPLAQEEWRRIGPELHRLGLLTDVDDKALAAYCWSYAVWREALETIAEMAIASPETKGLTIVSERGQMIQNPLVAAARRAADDMLTFAGQYGLTPAARARLAAGVRPTPSKFSGLISD